MRTRTLITGAAFLVVGVASAGKAQAQLNLKGSDTLDLVTTETISMCTGANGLITYVGGGSGGGESAMLAGQQHVAPMSSQLNSGAVGNGCSSSARQLLVGLDGIAILAKNSQHVDPFTCTDDVGGVNNPLVLTGIPSQ